MTERDTNEAGARNMGVMCVSECAINYFFVMHNNILSCNSRNLEFNPKQMEFGMKAIKRLIVCLALCSCAYGVADRHDVFMLEKDNDLSLKNFYEIVFENREIQLSEDAAERLDETRAFVDYLLEENIKVYGLTTGFADLRDCAVSPCQAGQLSSNIIQSHDAGIGRPLDYDVVLGAMVLRANSLAKGNSAFKKENLQTLIDMVNAHIVPGRFNKKDLIK
jgi:hypothetical protein